MVDLRDSAKYRIMRGPKLGYIRGEMFFRVVKTVIASAQDVRLVKEIGDAVLLTSGPFTPLFESLLLIGKISSMIADADSKEAISFGVRIGVSHGLAKKLMRVNEDYLGRPIDELARIMSIRPMRTNFVMHESAFKVARDSIAEYSYVRIGQPQMLSSDLSKGAPDPILYREVAVDLDALGKSRDRFAYWRRGS
jgi:hypothetical protein